MHQLGELGLGRVDQGGQPAQRRAARERRGRRPLGTGGRGRADGPVDLGGAGGGDLGQERAVGRRVDRLPLGGLDPLPGEEQRPAGGSAQGAAPARPAPRRPSMRATVRMRQAGR
jgi:hypothetical protein